MGILLFPSQCGHANKSCLLPRPAGPSQGGKALDSTYLARLSDADGAFLPVLLHSQAAGGKIFPVAPDEYRRLRSHRVRRADKNVTVSMPDDPEQAATAIDGRPDDVRESIKIQAIIADIGARMGMQIWIPHGDRAAVLAEWRSDHAPALERLPLNYDDTRLRAIEQIDILWPRDRSIKRAFEVEHTTSIYSGILRMADLLSLFGGSDHPEAASWVQTEAGARGRHRQPALFPG
jgi:hypothetical protein